MLILKAANDWSRGEVISTLYPYKYYGSMMECPTGVLKRSKVSKYGVSPDVLVGLRLMPASFHLSCLPRLQLLQCSNYPWCHYLDQGSCPGTSYPVLYRKR